MKPTGAVFLIPFLAFLAIACSRNSGDHEYYGNIGLSGGGVITNAAVSPVDEDILSVSTNMSGFFLSYEGPKHWNMVHQSQVRYSRCAPCFHPVDPAVIFAPGNRGLVVSRDSGNTWNPIGNLERPEGEIAIHPGQPDLMLAGSRGQVWRSPDGGRNWEPAEGPEGRVIGFHFDQTAENRSGVCYTATSQGIWHSDDGGLTWDKKVRGLPKENIRSFAGGSNKEGNLNVLYCLAGNNLCRISRDEGEWTVLNPDFPGQVEGITQWTYPSATRGRSQPCFLLASDAEAFKLYAVIGGPLVLCSKDAGETWESVYHGETSDSLYNLEYNYFTSYMGVNAGGRIYSAAIAPGNSDFLIFTTGMLCIYTEDGGDTWLNAHSTPVIRPGEEKPAAFFNTGLNVTTVWHYYIDPFEPDRHYIAYTDLGFARSLDAGKTWLFWPYWGPDHTLPATWHNTCYEMAFDPDIPGKVWGAFSRAHDIPNANAIVRNHVSRLPDHELQGGIAFADDFAATWQYEDWNHGLPNRPALSVIVDPGSPPGNRILYAAIWDDGVYKSTDDGHNWTRKSVGLGSGENMHVVRVQLHSDGTLFCLITARRDFSPDGVGLYKSTDGAETWELASEPGIFLWPKDFTLVPGNSNEIYVGADDAGEQEGALWKTLDGGATWTAVARKGAHFGAYLHPTRPGWIYMTLCEGGHNQAGLWLSRDNGKSWEPFEKVPHRWIQRVTFDPADDDIIYLSTFGASVIRLPADPEDMKGPLHSFRDNKQK